MIHLFRQFYFKDGFTAEKFSLMMGDASFNFGQNKLARALVKRSAIRFYYFNNFCVLIFLK